jgi:transposase, IS5 family
MPKHVSRANAAKSAVRAHVEHVFARQKVPWRSSSARSGLARVKIGLANLVYNMRRMVWLSAAAPA